MLKRIFASVLVLLTAACLLPTGAAAAEKEIPISEAYLSSEFGVRLRELELSGEWRADLVNVALSCVGYHEGESADDYGGANFSASGNFSEYSAVYYGMNGQWCAMFVSWCARMAGIPRYIINSASRAATDGVGGTAKYYFHLRSVKAENYTPVAGDIVFFSHSGWGTDHVGIVAEVTDTGIYTVEGNCLNAVRLNYYDFDHESIRRYGVYAQAEEEVETDDFTPAELIFVNSQGGHGNTPEGPEYSFNDLMAMEGRLITIPEGAFARDGFALAGYCVRRTDTDLWYTGDGWKDRKSLMKEGLRPVIIPDGYTWRYEGAWEGVAEAELYCVWKSTDGAYFYDVAMPPFNRPDGDGWRNPYPDVTEADWFYPIIKEADENGIILPDPGFRFNPTADCGRGDFISWLYRASKDKTAPEAESPFDDVAEEDAEAVNWAYTNSLIFGLSENKFGPDSPLSREQAAAVVFRLAGKPDCESEPDFIDSVDISPWARSAVAWARETGIISGVPVEGGAAFQPARYLNRAEALTIITRLDTLE